MQIGQKIASVQQVLNKCASNLQTSQAEGGNRSLIFDPAARDRAEEERIAQWVAHMNTALQSDGFVQFFQPVIHLAGEPEETFQVLLRLTGPNGDIVVGKDVGTGPGGILQVRVWSRVRFFPLRVRLIP